MAFKSKNFSGKIVKAIKKHSWKTAIYTLLMSAAATLMGLVIEYSFFKSNTGNLVQLTNSPMTNSPIIVDSPDAKVIYEGSTQIPMDRRIWVPFSNFKRYDGQPVKAIFNILYNLPNGKQAFVEEFPRNGIALFYFNDDCSEISVAEKYRRTEIQMEDVCWIDEATCNGLNIEKPITPGPKAIKDISSCIQ